MMRFIFIFSLLFASYTAIANYQPHDGDIIFQSSQSNQSKAIEQATNSPYSHVGIIFIKNGKPYVFEAASKVIYTPLDKWINRGKNKTYVIKRLKNHPLSQQEITSLKQVAHKFENKPYDIWFGWDDKYIYCSELVWKIYNRALKLKIGQLQTIKDFNLSSPAVKQKLKERYGNNIPYQETVISPVAIFNSPLLSTVDKRD
ncbi:MULTISPECIES: YiiX family permuted papain-like enzyme [Gilliamella]|uniref:YiiX family permuted papain-like enzyme n=2 Tax=Orbaceae TaxID=1240483 RepID=A0A2V4DJX3_9GAMM|nr:MULTISPECIES: YiiX family permuted papain-like enzyme [Gilliamella]MBI0038781.1 YiiX family permuted papain-like enzyme [Gilliamella sp. B14384G10]MBI0041098.1 YiiX family permuted papain-like enzyme [Gilliamella sp. B14384G7]MBI0052773.1 YiiX family permuted papain-like enzyme [Gilliamella sp. B14384G13]MBI0055068.1 YiiX family permuted papain-like enzyme [Gilliamella sp. B14384H2]MBI0104441.1 YiiX family permuted papain-like enzyme [Gilliamella sp. W8145]